MLLKRLVFALLLISPLSSEALSNVTCDQENFSHNPYYDYGADLYFTGNAKWTNTTGVPVRVETTAHIDAEGGIAVDGYTNIEFINASANYPINLSYKDNSTYLGHREEYQFWFRGQQEIIGVGFLPTKDYDETVYCVH